MSSLQTDKIGCVHVAS